MRSECVMNDQPEKLSPVTASAADIRRQELYRLFPEVRAESGRIDVDRLLLMLGETAEVGRERYGLTWPGKADCFRAIRAPSRATLRPRRDLSVAFDAAENMIVEGDNLEVLKLLQKPYLGQFQLIYIDPPYNTGNDFVYTDDYAEPLRAYLTATGQTDDQGRRIGSATETDGRFHSRWLSMMWPRLFMARTLLHEGGVIAVSIDEHEIGRLRLVLDEIFGEENFIAEIAVSLNPKGRQLAPFFATSHEYLLLYARDIEHTVLRAATTENVDPSDFPDKDEHGYFRFLPLRNTNKKFNPSTAGSMYFPLWGDPVTGRVSTVEFSSAIRILPVFGDGTSAVWRWSPRKVDAESDQLVAKAVNGHLGVRIDVFQKDRLTADRTKKLRTVWLSDEVGSTDSAVGGLKAMIGSVFPAPKPIELLRRLLSLFPKDALVLDFFAGSGTFGQAVLEQNNMDGGSRRFVLVQLPESTGVESEAGRMGLASIAAITRERVKRTLSGLNEGSAGLFSGHPRSAVCTGFRAFELAESNLLSWSPSGSTDASSLVKQLEIHVDHIRGGRTAEDLLFEVLLRSGYPPTSAVEILELKSGPVFSVAGGIFLICLERRISLDLLREVAARRPGRFVCLDAAFENDDARKANAGQILRVVEGLVFQTL